MCAVFEVSYTAPHTKTLYFKHRFFNNIYFLFFRNIAISIIPFILLIVVLLIVVMTEPILKRLKEKFGGIQITKSGSYNTNKSIIQIVIPTQRHSSWGT
jgi:hypothetical protein